MSHKKKGKEIVELLLAGVQKSIVAERLGVAPSTVTHHAKKCGLSSGPTQRYDWDKIAEYYRSGASYEQCCAEFGVTMGAMAKASQRGLFEPRPKFRKAMTASEHAEALQGKEHGRSELRKKILAERLLDYVCSECGLIEWRGKPLTLHLDHIDGNRRNNGLSNFRFLCPNCDDIQPTYGHRNRNRYARMA